MFVVSCIANIFYYKHRTRCRFKKSFIYCVITASDYVVNKRLLKAASCWFL